MKLYYICCSSAEKYLVYLAFNLHTHDYYLGNENGSNEGEPSDVFIHSIFVNLDDSNFKVALNAIYYP